MSKKFPQVDIPDFERLSKSPTWNPKLYSPLVFNPRIKKMAEDLKPGTLAYDDFWEEMDYYCYNGYEPEGMPRISGRHFYYLNFTKIKLLPKGKKDKILAHPNYRDLDHWIFLEIEAAVKYGYGLILAKPRQVGLSELGVVNVNYTLTFHYLAEAAIAAGKDDKVQEFKQKLLSSLENTHPAYRIYKETDNDKLMEFFFYDVINKQKVPRGINTKARFKTMYADSGAFEGINNNKISIFEEAGLFENIAMSFKATAPSFRSGAIQYGLPMVYGTGGEVDKGAKGYKEMWENSDSYNLKQIFVCADMYFPGDGIEDEKTGESISFFNHDTGVTNRAAARAYILRERKLAEKSKDTYIKHIQTYPLLPEEVFLKTKGGTLDLAKLNFQLKEINAGREPEPVLRGVLEWVDSPKTQALLSRATNAKERTKIRVANDSKVEFKIKDDGYMLRMGNPINKSVENHFSYRPDIGGCDSYDEEVDEANENVSSGCIMAYRVFAGPSRSYNHPVGMILQRGDGSYDDDEFYENSVKFAIYWHIEVLIEYTKFHIMRYFYDVGAHMYVRQKPMLEGDITSNHKNKDGVKMDGRIKTLGTKLLKIEVKENIHNYWMALVILDLIKYGDENTDIAMALLMCLFHRMDLFDEITEDIENYNDPTDYEEFGTMGNQYIDLDGNLRTSDSFQDEVKIGQFVPHRDMGKHQYDEHIREKETRLKEQMERRQEYENEDIMNDINEMAEIIRQEQMKWILES